MQHRHLWAELIALNAQHAYPVGMAQRSQRSSRSEPRRRAGLPGRPHALVAAESRGVMLAKNLATLQKENTTWLRLRKQIRCLKSIWNSMGSSKKFKCRLRPKVEPSEDLVARFQEFCEAHGEKVDRIGRFVRMMEAREQFCRSEAARLSDRARAAAGKIERTKNMALYYLLSRDLKKIEGHQFTLRAQKNSQDSVRITDEAAVPTSYCRIDARIDGVVWETVLSFFQTNLRRILESHLSRKRGRMRMRSRRLRDMNRYLVRTYIEGSISDSLECIVSPS